MLGFFQGEDKSIQRGEHHYKFGHVESYSHAGGEIGGLVHASYRSVTAHTRHVVFLIVFYIQPLIELLQNNRDWERDRERERERRGERK